MIVSLIVAAAGGGVIGKEGGMPWYLPAELAYFKKTTMGHPIIMGRKTHESIGKTLPGRTNIVITHNPNYQAAEASVVTTSLKEALEKLKTEKEVFVIGGESIYGEALPVADKLYLTKVKANIEGDKFFKYDPAQWQLTWSEKHSADNKNKYDYEFTILKRQPGK